MQLAGGEIVPVEGDVVVALGPWSCLLESWLDVPMPMEGAWSTSLVYSAPAAHAETEALSDALASAPAALFCEEDGRGCRPRYRSRSTRCWPWPGSRGYAFAWT